MKTLQQHYNTVKEIYENGIKKYNQTKDKDIFFNIDEILCDYLNKQTFSNLEAFEIDLLECYVGYILKLLDEWF